MVAIGEPLRLIHEGRIHPESIDVRILVPSRDIELAFPVPVEAWPDASPAVVGNQIFVRGPQHLYCIADDE